MRTRAWMWTPLLALSALATPLRAQDIGAQIGAGFLLAETVGIGGTVGLDLTAGGFYGRLSGEVMGTGAAAPIDQGTMRVFALSLGAGWMWQTSSGYRPYALAVVGSGYDWREGDDYKSYGGALGVEVGRVSGEVRYERWDQSGATHVLLPEDLLAAWVAVRIF